MFACGQGYSHYDKYQGAHKVVSVKLLFVSHKHASKLKTQHESIMCE